ncbi:MAG: sugar ABC transporter permease [Firmicutes bacterium]|nr:sugar ABC transporter permease [Bacillota bacterium]
MAKKNMVKTLTNVSTIENQNKIAYLFILPWLLGFLAFVIYPFFHTIYNTAFHITTEANNLVYVFNLMEHGGNFGTAFRNLYFFPQLLDFIVMEVTYVPTIIIVAFILALLLNTGNKGQSTFRVIYFFPVIIMSGPVAGILRYNGAGSLFDYVNNIIFKMLVSFSPRFASALSDLFANFTMVLWFTGIPIILFINALQKINTNLYEAAKIDGASSWQILWKIKVPIVKSTGFIVSIFTIVQIGTYALNPIYNTIKNSIYDTAAGIGLASTFAFIYTVTVFTLVGLAYLLLGREAKSKVIHLSSIQKASLEAVHLKRQSKNKRTVNES